MSGGSYNYLYHKEFSDIPSMSDEMENMCDRLYELGFNDLAKETNNILKETLEIQARMNERLAKIQKVWHSVEYMDSGDSGIEWVNDEVKKYRGINTLVTDNLTKREAWVLKYLEAYKDQFITPSQVGKAYGLEVLNRPDCHSATASPILKSLTEKNKVIRNHRGWYKLNV